MCRALRVGISCCHGASDLVLDLTHPIDLIDALVFGHLGIGHLGFQQGIDRLFIVRLL